mgnify:CR=1 FL=1
MAISMANSDISMAYDIQKEKHNTSKSTPWLQGDLCNNNEYNKNNVNGYSFTKENILS